MTNSVKRFWTEVTVDGSAAGYAVHLDARPVKTPGKRDFRVGSHVLARAIAQEWEAQGEVVDPAAMPLTRYVNSVLDGLAEQRDEVIGIVAGYAGTDLLCYRAESPDTLVARQAERWDPLLDWARTTYDAPLILAAGVMPVSQPPTSLERLKTLVTAHDDFELAALHDLVAISGSLILGLAVSEKRLSAPEAFALSRLDEDWQIEQWGEDEEAAAVAVRKAGEFSDAARFLELTREK